MQREKESVFVVGLGGGIDLPSSWLTFLFRQSSSVSFLSPSPTHTLIPKALQLFFSLLFPLSLPHCPRSISAPSSLCLPLKPPPQRRHTFTHSSGAHCSHHQMKYIKLFSSFLKSPPCPPFNSIPSTWEPKHSPCTLLCLFLCL